MIVSDIIESQTLRRDKDGFSVDRVFVVDEVGGGNQAKLYNAMIAAGIPQYGEPHPFLDELQVTSITAAPLKSGTQAKINVTYSIPDIDEVSEIEAEEGETSSTLVFSSSLSSEVEFSDINGELLAAQYFQSTAGTFQQATKYEEADVQRPQLKATFSRTEADLPKTIVSTYLGKVNANSWSGFPPKTWLCSGITSRESKGKFDVEYEFVYRPQTWRLEVVVGISQEEADKFPIDVDSGNGYAVYDVYDTIDFNNLGLSF